MSLPLRLSKRIRPGSEYTSARTPSHLISYAQRPSSGGSAPARASIGLMCSGIGPRFGSVGGSMRWIIQSLPGASPFLRLSGNSP